MKRERAELGHRDLKPDNIAGVEVTVSPADDAIEAALERWLLSLLESPGTPGEGGRP